MSTDSAPTLDAAITRAVTHLTRRQTPEGWWRESVVADEPTTVRTAVECVLLDRVLRRPPSDVAMALGARLMEAQRDDGSFGNLSTSVLVYQAMKLTGQSADGVVLGKARASILARGGAAACDPGARRWLATLGELAWSDVPTVPVEWILLPPWAPFSLERVAPLARVTVVARMLQSAHRWSAHLAPEQGIQELWLGSASSEGRPPHASPPLVSWRHLLSATDRLAKSIGYTPLVGLHRRAVARAIEWLLQRQSASGAWSDDARVTIAAVSALHAIGFAIDHPVMLQALRSLDAAVVVHDGAAMVTCGVDARWQTAQAVRALRAAAVPPADAALTRATAVLAEPPPPALAPDVDTTASVILAVPDARTRLRAEITWMTERQSWNGGYAATDVHQVRTPWQQTALADEIALCDPPTPAITGHVLEAMHVAGVERLGSRAVRAIDFLRHAIDDDAWSHSVLDTAAALAGVAAMGEPLAAPFATAVEWLQRVQHADGHWDGGEAASPAVATAVASDALAAIEPDDPAVARGIAWLLGAQRPDGSWDGGLRRDGLCFTIAATTAPLLALAHHQRRELRS